MTIDKDAARRLAIGYHAYLTAGADNWQMWAKYLIKAQRDCGVEMLPVSTLLYEAPDAAPKPLTPYEAALRVEPARGVLRQQSGMIEGPDEGDEGDGGALVPAPKPAPRKPSPGAAEQARQWAIAKALRTV